jgi:uncharacterized membrane protein
MRFTGKSFLIIVFILCALPVGIIIAALTPPGQSPDEPAHVGRAASLLHGGILGVRKTVTDPNTGQPMLVTGLKVDKGIVTFDFDRTKRIYGRPVMTIDDYYQLHRFPSNHEKKFDWMPNTATYLPVAYLPATMGLAIGLVFQQPPWVELLLARLMNFFALLAFGVAALAIAAYGEALLLAVLLLPITLFLAATVNQDGVLIGMVCLACAALTRAERHWRIVAMGLLAIFLCSKQPFVPLLLVLLLPLERAGLLRRVRDVVITALPMLLWTALVAAFVIVPFGQPPHHPGPLFAGDRSVIIDHADPAANLHILLADPTRFLTLPWHGTVMFWHFDLRDMIAVFGPFEYWLPLPFDIMWGLCLVAGFLGLFFTPRMVAGRPVIKDFFVVVGGCFLSYWLINIALYLTWTGVGEDYVAGFQGRYLVFFWPVLLLAVPVAFRKWQVPVWVPAVPAMVLGLFDLGYLPFQLVIDYYLH